MPEEEKGEGTKIDGDGRVQFEILCETNEEKTVVIAFFTVIRRSTCFPQLTFLMQFVLDMKSFFIFFSLSWESTSKLCVIPNDHLLFGN